MTDPLSKTVRGVTVRLPNQLGMLLKSLRKIRSLSQAQLGAALGVTQTRIAQIESNPGSVSLDQIMTVLEVLDADLIVKANTKDLLPSRPKAKAGKPRNMGKAGKPEMLAASPTPSPAARSSARKSAQTDSAQRSADRLGASKESTAEALEDRRAATTFAGFLLFRDKAKGSW